METMQDMTNQNAPEFFLNEYSFKAYMQWSYTASFNTTTANSKNVEDFARKYHKAFSDHQKHKLVKNYIIPNDRTDIHSFFILAASMVGHGDYNKPQLEYAWEEKFYQAYSLAQKAFYGDTSYSWIEGLYQSKLNDISIWKKKYYWRCFGVGLACIFPYIISLLLIWVVDLLS